jgi:hypothetical protein
MPDWSRRRALQAVATTGAFALAGCSGETSHSRSVPRERGDPVPPAELDVRFDRDTDGRPLFEIESEFDDGDGETTDDERDDERHDVGRDVEHLTDEEDRERVAFRSTPAATDLRAFVEGSDLDAGSVFLLQRPIGECYETRLVGVYRETDGVDADFCQALRPADVECSADDRDTVGVAIRLPFPGDDLSGLGWSWRGDCDHAEAIASEGGAER